jgi:hypothetical protein
MEVRECLLSFGSESLVFLFAIQNYIIKIDKTIILPVVLYGCETWSLTLREEHRLRVSENRLLRRILGPKRDEVRGEWRKLHNEKFKVLYLHTYIYILTYLLTSCSRVLLEKLTGSQLVKKFPAIYGTRMFITTFTSFRHLFLS